jgi:hypothetical protein
MGELAPYVPFNPNAPRPVVGAVLQPPGADDVADALPTVIARVHIADVEPAHRVVMPVAFKSPAFNRGSAISHSRNVLPKDALRFDSVRKAFVCLTCQVDCRHKIGPDHVPSEVWCTGCILVCYPGKSLPDTWVNRRIWVTSTVIEPLAQAASSAFGSIISKPSARGSQVDETEAVAHKLTSMWVRLTISNDPSLLQGVC